MPRRRRFIERPAEPGVKRFFTVLITLLGLAALAGVVMAYFRYFNAGQEHCTDVASAGGNLINPELFDVDASGATSVPEEWTTGQNYLKDHASIPLTMLRTLAEKPAVAIKDAIFGSDFFAPERWTSPFFFNAGMAGGSLVLSYIGRAAIPNAKKASDVRCSNILRVMVAIPAAVMAGWAIVDANNSGRLGEEAGESIVAAQTALHAYDPSNPLASASSCVVDHTKLDMNGKIPGGLVAIGLIGSHVLILFYNSITKNLSVCFRARRGDTRTTLMDQLLDTDLGDSYDATSTDPYTQAQLANMLVRGAEFDARAIDDLDRFIAQGVKFDLRHVSKIARMLGREEIHITRAFGGDLSHFVQDSGHDIEQGVKGCSDCCSSFFGGSQSGGSSNVGFQVDGTGFDISSTGDVDVDCCGDDCCGDDGCEFEI